MSWLSRLFERARSAPLSPEMACRKAETTANDGTRKFAVKIIGREIGRPGVASQRPDEILAAGPEETGETPGVRPRVLVVDDNADGADALVELLKLDGYDARAAYTGAQTISVASRFRPHVAVLDISLPEMDGYEIALALRRDAMLGDVALIAVTGYGLENDRRRAQNAGFDHHFAKPVAYAEFQRVLTTLLERRSHEE